MRAWVLVFLVALQPAAQTANLRIQLVGNAGVMLSDGVTSLLIDLPYESGAFGYQSYMPDELQPPGSVVSVIIHGHRDHFDPQLFLARPGWQIIGSPTAIGDVPAARVVAGNDTQVGSFTITAVPTPHTEGHRSYRIVWGGRTLYFVGDTEDPTTLQAAPRPDVLFITPWLSCLLEDSGRQAFGVRTIAYHRAPAGSDRICGPVEVLEQGTTITLSAMSVPGSEAGNRPGEAALPAGVVAYLDEALDALRREALYSERVDWVTLREATLAQAAGSLTTPGTYAAIRFALEHLGAGHSFFQLSDSLRNAERSARGVAPEFDAPPRSDRPPSPFGNRMNPESSTLEVGTRMIGRLVMPQGMRDDAFATDFQHRMSDLDSERLCGWIIDLRGNGGGNMWPMLAGLGPLTGDGHVGGSVDAAGRRDRWLYVDGRAIYEDPQGLRSTYAQVTRAAFEPRSGVPVAVLFDRGTASSGEAMALAFRGRPHTRSFGEPTYGASTTTRGFRLSDGANLVVAVSTMTDRNHDAASAGLQPEQAVEHAAESGADRDPVVDAAAAWLLEHPACRP